MGSSRKQRRPASNSPSNASIPLARPNRDPPSEKDTKTLVDLIAERQTSLTGAPSSHVKADQLADANPNLEFMTIDPSNLPENDRDILATARSNNTTPEENADKPLPPLIDTLLLSIPLTTLHLTLAYLAAHQYAESVNLKNLLRESALVAFPMLSLLIHLAHGHLISLSIKSRKSPTTTNPGLLPLIRSFLYPPTPRTILFLPLALLLGSKLVALTNTDPYYAVMRKAPAIGTLWVWSILEIPLLPAVVGALGPLLWGIWWMGYDIF